MENHVLRQMGFATKAIHGGHKKDFYGALASPIFAPQEHPQDHPIWTYN